MKAQGQIPAQKQGNVFKLNHFCLSDTNIKACMKENPV